MANVSWKSPPTDAELLEVAKSTKVGEINRAAAEAVSDVRAQYPDFERETWVDQEREARAWTADNTADTPTLGGIASARGVTIADLAPRVIKKADQYRSLAASVAGKRQGLEDAIGAATSVADVESVAW